MKRCRAGLTLLEVLASVVCLTWLTLLASTWIIDLQKKAASTRAHASGFGALVVAASLLRSDLQLATADVPIAEAKSICSFIILRPGDGAPEVVTWQLSDGALIRTIGPGTEGLVSTVAAGIDEFSLTSQATGMLRLRLVTGAQSLELPISASAPPASLTARATGP
jgi:hypothetical protein